MQLYSVELEAEFPNLRHNEYKITSEPTRKVNCLAWAAGDLNRNWQWGDVPVRGYYWPPGAPKADSIDAWVRIFEILAYKKCDSREFQAGVSRIAIYGNEDGEATHAARQEDASAWTSKLGDGEDIRHTLEGLEGESYGTVKIIMERQLATVVSHAPDAS